MEQSTPSNQIDADESILDTTNNGRHDNYLFSSFTLYRLQLLPDRAMHMEKLIQNAFFVYIAAVCNWIHVATKEKEIERERVAPRKFSSKNVMTLWMDNNTAHIQYTFIYNNDHSDIDKKKEKQRTNE